MYHFLNTNTHNCINPAETLEPDTYIPRLELSQLSIFSEQQHPSEFSPRPSTGRAASKSEPKRTRTKSSSGKPRPAAWNLKSTSTTSARISKAQPPEQLQISQQYTEPYFELSGEFSYGCAESARKSGANADGNNSFNPDAKQLKKEGGKSIKLYEDWRIMQYHQNVVMKKFLNNHGINGSVLPPCTSFDMWKDSKWRELYRQATGMGLDQDPCPDCDVRFFKDAQISNKYSYKIAPASLLNSSGGWRKRRFLNSIFVIGLPQHITVACCREFSDHVVFEFFDPAGAGGDSVSIKAVKEWTQTYLKDKYSTPRREKPVIFSQVCKSINCQADKADVMCQTWIWWWVYWRMVRQANVTELTRHLKEQIKKRKTLQHVSAFKQWLIELYNLGYLQRECAYERRAAAENTPKSKSELQALMQRDLNDFGVTMGTVFRAGEVSSRGSKKPTRSNTFSERPVTLEAEK